MAAKVGEDEAQGGQRPEKTHVALRHQNQQADEKQRFKKHAQQDLRIGRAGLDRRGRFRRQCTPFMSPICVHAFFQQDDAGGLEDETDKQNQEQFYHKFCRAVRPPQFKARLLTSACYKSW